MKRSLSERKKIKKNGKPHTPRTTTDPLGSAPNGESSVSSNAVQDGGSKQLEIANGKCPADSIAEGQEEGDGDEDNPEDAEEDDSDLDFAWKMLDVARAIVEKVPGDTMEKLEDLQQLVANPSSALSEIMEIMAARGKDNANGVSAGASSSCLATAGSSGGQLQSPTVSSSLLLTQMVQKSQILVFLDEELSECPHTPKILNLNKLKELHYPSWEK